MSQNRPLMDNAAYLIMVYKIAQLLHWFYQFLFLYIHYEMNVHQKRRKYVLHHFGYFKNVLNLSPINLSSWDKNKTKQKRRGSLTLSLIFGIKNYIVQWPITNHKNVSRHSHLINNMLFFSVWTDVTVIKVYNDQWTWYYFIHLCHLVSVNDKSIVFRLWDNIYITGGCCHAWSCCNIGYLPKLILNFAIPNRFLMYYF